MQPLSTREVIRRKRDAGYTVDEVLETTPRVQIQQVLDIFGGLGGSVGSMADVNFMAYAPTRVAGLGQQTPPYCSDLMHYTGPAQGSPDFLATPYAAWLHGSDMPADCPPEGVPGQFLKTPYATWINGVGNYSCLGDATEPSVGSKLGKFVKDNAVLLGGAGVALFFLLRK